MTGAELDLLLQRRLAAEGLTDPELGPDQRAEALTMARDELVDRLAMAAPVAVQSVVTLEVDGSDDRLYTVPSATRDPVRVLEVRDVTCGRPLSPSGNLNVDGGDYRWETPRQLRLADDVSASGGLEAVVVVSRDAIDAASQEAEIGLPTPCHRAIGLGAAVLLLTRNEQSSAPAADALYQREADRLERLYSEFDAQGGAALRALSLEQYGGWQGDSL